MMLTSAQIKNLVRALQNDEIVIMPTDTIYGFGAKNSSHNQTKINQLKNAPLTKPLITLISNQRQLSSLVRSETYSPHLGLLHQGTTVIFPKLKDTKQTIAIRWVHRPDLVTIINNVGPLWSSSLNYHHQRAIHDLETIKSNFPDLKIFNDQNLTVGQPSKIYDTLHNKWLR